MNLYSNNCRIFCARMAREVEKLNAEGDDALSASARAAQLAADARLALAIARAGVLPMLYPLGVVALCWGGLKDIP